MGVNQREVTFLQKPETSLFNQLSARDRWQIISSSENPSDDLKARCQGFLPGVEFNFDGFEGNS